MDRHSRHRHRDSHVIAPGRHRLRLTQQTGMDDRDTERVMWRTHIQTHSRLDDKRGNALISFLTVTLICVTACPKYDIDMWGSEFSLHI